MASDIARTRFSCKRPGCQRSYLRPEHLTRHSLTHKQRAFACYFCQRQFTRNDLLQVHLRRHEGRAMEVVERQKSQSPPHKGHRDELLRKSNPLWEENLSPLDLADETPIFKPPTSLGNDVHSTANNGLQAPAIGLLPNFRVPIEHSQRLLAEVPSLHLIQIVRDRLANNPSEISREVRQVLERLLDDDRTSLVFEH